MTILASWLCASLLMGPEAAPRSRKALMPFLDRAAACSGKADWKCAAEALQGALAISPRDPATLFNLTQVYVHGGEGAKALPLLRGLAERGLGFDPGVDPAFAKLPGYDELVASFERHTPRVSRSERAALLREADLFPEGIACDAATGNLFVGSILKRKIVRVDAKGAVSDFVAPRRDGLVSVLGIKVDSRRHELWAAASGGPEFPDENGHSGLFRFDLRTGALAGKYLLPSGTAHMLNDLAFDADGNAYLSDTTTGAIYRLSAALKELEVFISPGTFRGPNGVAVSDDSRHLYVASSGRGLSAVDLKTKAVTDLAVSEDVVAAGIDGLYFHRDSLVGVQNGIGPGRVMRYHLSAPTVIARAEILESGIRSSRYRLLALSVATTSSMSPTRRSTRRMRRVC